MNKVISLAIAGLAAASVSHAALADGGAKFLGNITTSSQIRSDMGTYWNQLTNENGCKWGSIHSVDANGRSVFNFNGFDSCENGYKWAKAAPGRTFKFHALIWGSQKPDFLCTKKNPSITKEKTKQYIEEWFDAVAAKFPDLEYIDVVNEAIWAGDNYHSGYSKPAAGAEGISTDDPDCGGTYIVQALGGDDVIDDKHQYNFVQTAFEMARDRWPNAKLIYNDYNTLSWQMDEGIEMMQTLIANGAPIDFYGQQAHDCKGMSKSDFESKLTRIHNETGLPLLISEYDIGEADDNKQKNDYANQIPFMWETPWIGGITIWGYILGATWADNTGIMRQDGTKRAAMKWLEEYFAQNLDKGQYNITFTPTEPVPQEPFGGVATKVPGKVEVENFDKPGVGRNPDTKESNASFSDKSSENAGKSTYRSEDAPAVDLYDEGTGVVLGMTQTGEYLEYTLDFAEGDYEVIVNASSGNATSAFQLYIDGKAVGDEVKMEQTGDNDWSVYKDVTVKIGKVSAGKHVFKLAITGDYVNIDYFTFQADGVVSIGSKPQLNTTVVRDDYDLFTMNGVFMNRLTAYGMDAAVSMVKSNGINLPKGMYFLRSKATGNLQTVRIAK